MSAGRAREQVVVVVPTYNEVETLPQVVAGVLEHGCRVLVVDDASPDGTGRLADRLARDFEAVDVVHRGAKLGLGSAYTEGFSAAHDGGARVLCEMDADLSHDPAQLPLLLAALEDGADVAIGSRFVPGGSIVNWSLRRRLLSRWGNRYARSLLGVPIRDMTSGYRAFTAEAVRSLRPDTCASAGYAFQVEMAWRAHRIGLRVVEVPITFTERRSGHSKLDGPIVREAVRLVTRWGVRRFLGRGAPPIDGGG